MSNGGIKSAISKKGQKLENYLFSTSSSAEKRQQCDQMLESKVTQLFSKSFPNSSYS